MTMNKYKIPFFFVRGAMITIKQYNDYMTGELICNGNKYAISLNTSHKHPVYEYHRMIEDSIVRHMVKKQIERNENNK